MATISLDTNEKTFAITRWLGLNEAADGDTKLKTGEASVCNNFRITRSGNLQKRPGTLTVQTLGSDAVKCLWSGNVKGTDVLLGACSGKLYSLYSELGEFQKVELGDVNTNGNVSIFGFSEIAYILTDTEYKQWDGTTLQDVHGYRPLVAVTVAPNGGGDTMENINRLNGERRCWISPDGTNSTFQLPEKSLQSIDYVKNLSTGLNLPEADYTYSLTDGTVTFGAAPVAGANSYEIGWTMATTYRQQVISMKFCEFYNSTQDTRVFLYGDGSNKAIYSGIDYNGKPRADYFPDMYEVAVGDANTPITSLIRHYSRLLCFKTSSTYSITYGEITLADGSVTSAFYTTPINRALGNKAPGQVRLVLNSPRTLDGSDLYEWKNNSNYSSNLTADERQAKRISDRIASTLSGWSVKNCRCFDDNYSQEYWIIYGNNALVNNYVSDAWYYYSDLSAYCLENIDGKFVIGTNDGKLKHMDYSYKSDDEKPIECYWESGSMSFGKDYQLKYSANLWIGVVPEGKSQVDVTISTNKKLENTVKSITESLLFFDDVDFEDFSFDMLSAAQIHRIKIKAKKFVFYKLIFSCNNSDSAATILSSDIKVRFMGEAK